MPIRRQWTDQETNVAFAALEELRTQKNATLSKIASQIEPLLAEVKEPESSMLSRRDIYNKLLNTGSTRLGKIPSLAQKIVENGLVVGTAGSKRGPNQRGIEKVRSGSKGQVKHSKLDGPTYRRAIYINLWIRAIN